MKQYQAVLFAPDGDYVTDFRERKTIEDVWSEVENMGSRWIFYPIGCVATDKTIVDVAYGVPEWFKGKRIKTIRSILKGTNQEDLCNAINNGIPIELVV